MMSVTMLLTLSSSIALKVVDFAQQEAVLKANSCLVCVVPPVVVVLVAAVMVVMVVGSQLHTCQ